jgi:hypothetical protein
MNFLYIVSSKIYFTTTNLKDVLDIRISIY